MKTYKVRAVIRPDDHEGPEQIVRLTVQAEDQYWARRFTLQAAWDRGMLVSGFKSIKRMRRREK